MTLVKWVEIPIIFLTPLLLYVSFSLPINHQVDFKSSTQLALNYIYLLCAPLLGLWNFHLKIYIRTWWFFHNSLGINSLHLIKRMRIVKIAKISILVNLESRTCIPSALAISSSFEPLWSAHTVLILLCTLVFPYYRVNYSGKILYRPWHLEHNPMWPKNCGSNFKTHLKKTNPIIYC